MMKNSMIALLLLVSSFAFSQVQTEYYPNGNKKSEGAYISNSTAGSRVVMASDGSSRLDPNQAKTGKWTYWYDSGSISAEEYFNAGNTSGVWKTWYPSGMQSSEINYTTGKAVFWYTNGKKQSEGSVLENRVFTGKWTAWYETGIKNYEGNYFEGKKDGDWQWFDSTGKQTSKETYSKDKLLDTEKF